MVATTRKPLPRGTSPRRSSIFSTLSKMMSLSEGSSDFSWSKHLRMMVSGVGWSLVSIFSFLASSTRLLLMESEDTAFTHAMRLQFLSSYFSARAAASWVLPQPRIPTPCAVELGPRSVRSTVLARLVEQSCLRLPRPVGYRKQHDRR